MASQKVKKDEVLANLRLACARGLPLDVRIVGDQPVVEYRSRFLGIEGGAKEPLLIIEAPGTGGSIIPVRPGRTIRATYFHDSRYHSFAAEVVGRGKFVLNPETTVSSLQLSLPEDIWPERKREYFRIPVDANPPIPVKLAIMARGTRRPGRIRARETGILTDIGGGGIGFCVPEGRSLMLDLGTRVTVEFSLPSDDEEPIYLMSRVCFCLRKAKEREVLFGVQFIDVDSDVEYKRGVNRILKYVAEEQRRSLRQRTRRSL
jgi:c-di-GMP-binding flagellar brake protein YcgR